MSSCQSSSSTMSIFLHRSSSRLHSHRCCCVLDQISASNLSSASSVFTSANLIAAAARGSGSLHLHGAVTSAITHLAVSALAIASGACLSTKVDFLWPRLEEQPGSIELDGVDVTGYPIFNDSKVRKAIDFAKRAHHGQLRKTGDPYLTHCIHTGRILAMLVPASGKRAVDTVVAGILHDVVDDTFESLRSIEQEFGEDVAKLVARVSRLSYINQLLRRHRRINMTQGEFGQEEADNLRVMLLGMVDDPRVVLIKLADRLHNMRTIYALPLPKARAVAQETLVVWCSLASRLGLWAMKAELEDLCFAVIQPEVFRKMRADLASMWSASNKAGNKRRMLAKASVQFSEEKNSSSGNEDGVHIDENSKSMKDLLEAVVPFDILTDRRKRSRYITDMGNNSEKLSLKAKVVQDAAVALASMEVCEEALERELLISTSYVPGMEVTLSSRLKSLYSIYCKMRRKDISINKVYDARALRVIIGDKNGTLHGPAVQCCYSFLHIVHRFWTPINGEFDDYIVNPKPSGYQSLHTAVLGPDSSALEVQIRTQKMHEYAEHGHAAHWLYKETVNLLPSVSNEDEPESSFLTESREDDEESVVEEDRKFEKYGGLKPGHPVLRIEGGHLLAAVIINVDKGGRELLVAVSFVLAASEAVADRRSSSQRNRWEAYAKLYKKVSNEWWCQPGHGDWSTCLERYTLCRDGMYHKQDQFGRFLPTFIQVIELTEQEESEYWRIVSAVFEGKQIDSTFQSKQPESGSGLKSSSSLGSVARGVMNNKVQLLRTMLQWEEQMRTTTTPASLKKKGDEDDGGEVVIVWWPHGEIMRLRSGSTAADAACRVGLDSKFVAVNGHLVQPSTQLHDGDVVEVRVRV